MTHWVVARPKDLGGECRRCLASFAPKLPALVDDWTAELRTFLAAHSKCKPTPEATEKAIAEAPSFVMAAERLGVSVSTLRMLRLKYGVASGRLSHPDDSYVDPFEPC